MATVGHVNARSCRNGGSGNTAIAVADNQSTTPIAVSLTDVSGMAYPDLKPAVKKADTGGEPIYGKFDSFDQGSDDITVVTGGIQSFLKSTAHAAGDIGDGIIAGAAPGQVETSATQGVGQVVGRGAGNIIWVDLDAGTRGTA